MTVKLFASLVLALSVHSPFHHTTTKCERTFTVAMDPRDRRHLSSRPTGHQRPEGPAQALYPLSAQSRCRRFPASSMDDSRQAAADAWSGDRELVLGCLWNGPRVPREVRNRDAIAPCGTRVRLCNGGTCVVATRDDSGPYVGGRTFDLDPTTRDALSCSALCTVSYRVMS